jgi:hypothetical protein
MNINVVRICGVFLLCGLATASSQELKLKRGYVCWPLHYAGITLGVTTQPEVQRLLGDGVFRKDEGDTGGRYFIDEKRAATLHVVSYTDFVVGEVTLQSGIPPTLQTNELKQAESKWFTLDYGFGNWHALRLGSTQGDVLKNLGEPNKRLTANDWRYETVCECEIPEYFDVFFKDGRIVKVVFSAPAG